MHRTRLSLDGLAMSPEKVAKLRRWILSLVTVNFDLDVGPKITSMYPPLGLTHAEAQNIAFSSFPDSAHFEEGSQTHSFRMRLRSHVDGEPRESDAPRPTTLDGFIYGFSCFTRTKDASSKRGYQQTSIVVLSHLAYPNLFYTLISKLAPSFMTHGGPMLEAACHNISNWSDPLPGTTSELGFLGTVLHVELPEAIETQQSMSAITPARLNETDLQILASICPSDLPMINHFEAVVSHLWSIWECVVLSEPMLIFSPSPAMSSAAVWWLRDLIRPIPLSGDFRPFFTIHDADHIALVNPRTPPSGLLIGVTNPFFERACKHWPNILSLGRALPQPALKNGSASPGIVVGPAPGWKSTHKRYTSRDHAVLKQLEQACRGSEPARRAASEAMRQHFTARTNALLVPLQRYLQTLIPTPSESRSNLSAAARLKPFQDAAFFASLKAHGSPLPFKSNTKQREFYERWLRTPAFGVWLARQEEVVQGVLQSMS
ncbi:DUF1630-domain-containing protein [Epithele typhae]|uniref:DUF1630-domain-containing protein n=1 Tax=Epithele typhae TaxID=378194 RepID=UPI00200844E7|nr:DUF1630-domain-containing protein [Epithele typhae]KAH9945275.1 DUF1630-domain-containing protein [Epithele typhae]